MHVCVLVVVVVVIFLQSFVISDVRYDASYTLVDWADLHLLSLPLSSRVRGQTLAETNSVRRCSLIVIWLSRDIFSHD